MLTREQRKGLVCVFRFSVRRRLQNYAKTKTRPKREARQNSASGQQSFFSRKDERGISVPPSLRDKVKMRTQSLRLVVVGFYLLLVIYLRIAWSSQTLLWA